MNSSSEMSCCGWEDESNKPAASGTTVEGVLIRPLKTPSGRDLVEVMVQVEGAA